jgi:transcriptional regulator with XRE-family HTH domain
MTKLAEHINSHELTQVEFARRVNSALRAMREQGIICPEDEVSQGAISLWVHAHRRPGAVYAKAIEQATNGEVPSDYWLSVKAENNNGRKRQKRVSRG